MPCLVLSAAEAKERDSVSWESQAWGGQRHAQTASHTRPPVPGAQRGAGSALARHQLKVCPSLGAPSRCLYPPDNLKFCFLEIHRGQRLRAHPARAVILRWRQSQEVPLSFWHICAFQRETDLGFVGMWPHHSSRGCGPSSSRSGIEHRALLSWEA